MKAIKKNTLELKKIKDKKGKRGLSMGKLEPGFKKSEELYLGSIISVTSTDHFLRKVLRIGSIDLEKHYVILYLHKAPEIYGYHIHSIGTLKTIDIKKIISTAIANESKGVIVGHYGTLKATNEERKLTDELCEVAKSFNIWVGDHIIIGKTSFYSFGPQAKSLGKK